MTQDWPKRRLIMAASQFFAQFAHMTPDALSRALGGRVSASTIRRDRERLKHGEAPSSNSVAAYLTLQNRPAELDLTDPDAVQELVQSVLDTRRAFYAQFTPDPYRAGTPISWPSFWPLAQKRFDEGEWLSVIDLIEPALTGKALTAFRAAEHSESEPYLRHHLAVAHLNRGDIRAGIEHLRAGLDLLWHTNAPDRLAVRYHLAVDLALNLMSLPSEMRHDNEVFSLVKKVIEDPLPHPNMVCNLMIIAMRSDDQASGYIAGRIAEQIKQSEGRLDFAETLSRIVTDTELIDYQHNDMLQTVRAALIAATASQKGPDT